MKDKEQFYSALALMCLLRHHKQKRDLLEYLKTDRKTYTPDALRKYEITNDGIEIVVATCLRKEQAVESSLIIKNTKLSESVMQSLTGKSLDVLFDIDWLSIPQLVIIGRYLAWSKTKHTQILIKSDPLSYDQAVNFVKGL
jgi:hypothetical protein